ncbi:hypothetical protein [Bryobacter aggregatus]|uniref:hypothetical protein n=1 Tax=Bryobacter aggregatus TaxID=360054 RepID=UPI0004E11412|nr:hypothetical protein [Bryobacter aggregatus]
MIPFTIASALVAETQNGDPILNVLRSSMETKKGVTLYLHGQTIGLLVTAIGEHFIEGRNQQASKIVVRIASIDAAALS